MRLLSTRFVVFLVFVAAFGSSVKIQARPWQGIEPGKSTRTQVVQKFGEPIRELKNHGSCAVLLNFQNDRAIKGTKQANFCVDAKGLVVEITVFPKRTLSRDVIEEAYGKKYLLRLTDDFRDYFLYRGQGLEVFFEPDGKTVNSFRFTAAHVP